MKLTIRRPPGRHWKLKAATIAAFAIAASLAFARNWIVAGVAIMIGVVTLAVQWICISPPEVDEPYIDRTPD